MDTQKQCYPVTRTELFNTCKTMAQILKEIKQDLLDSGCGLSLTSVRINLVLEDFKKLNDQDDAWHRQFETILSGLDE